MLHIQIVKSILPGQVAVKANTAACFILIGFALWILRREQPSRAAGWRLAAKIAAGLTSVAGLLSLPECLWGWDLGIDQLLFTAGAEDIPGSVRPGLMSPITAFAFLTLGAALLLLDVKPRLGRWSSPLLSSGAAIASLFGVLDFVLDPTSTRTHISPITAFALFLFAFALLLSRTQSGLGALVASATLGGTLTRRLVPAAILVPLVIGWLRWKLEIAGLYSEWTGLTMMTVITVVLLAGLTAWTASLIDRGQREQERTEQDRLASEEKFRLLLDGVKEYAIYMLDPEGRVVSWNAGAENLKGYRAEEILGQHFFCFYTAKDREDDVPNQELQKAISLGRFASQGERVRKDGSAFWADVVIAPLHDEAGKLRGFSKVVRDVTERKRAEQKLRASENRYRTLAENLPQMVFVKDRASVNVSCNQTFARSLGIRPEEYVGKTDYDFFPAELAEKYRSDDQRVMESGKTEEIEEEYIRDGEKSSVQTVKTPLRDAAGNVTGILGIFWDITERKRVQEQLRQSSLYTRSLIEASLDPLVTISREGKITDVNEATEKVTGVSRRQLIGSDFSTYFTEPESARRGYEQVFAQGAVQDYPLAIRRTTGEVTNVLYNASVFRSESGEVEGVFAAARDVTERKRAEEEVHRLNEELEQRVIQRTAQLEAANKELEAFTYSVSHDLRAPLRHISGFSKMLTEEFGSTLPPDAQHHLQRIQEGTRRMGLLVDDLLNLGRIGRHEVKLQATGLNSIVNEVVDELKPEWAGRQVEWRVANLPFVECDPALMKQVFQNLLSNAVKFTRTRSQAVIEVGQKDQEGTPAVFVRDNGVGFNVKYADKLFGVFQRLHRPEDFEGTGVGLATVQRIVQKHGGRIWAEAELDKGATFFFTLGASDKTELQTNAATVGAKT